MNFPILNAKVISLKEGETIIIRFANNDEFCGTLIINYDFNISANKQRKERMRKVLMQVAPFVTDTTIR